MIRLEDDDDLIDIRYDNVFKAVFTRNTPASQGALSRLVSAFIEKDITVTSITANEPPADSIEDRQIRFDISCKSAEGELINVEMSLNPTPAENDRLAFYGFKLFIGQDIRGAQRSYADLHAAYQITILDKGIFFHDEDAVHAFTVNDLHRRVTLTEKFRIITLELAKMEAALRKPLKELNIQEQWGVFFRYLTDRSKRRTINELIAQEEGIAMASEVLIHISKDEIERARLISKEKYELDTQARLYYAEQEGIEKGRAEGREEGREEGRVETARKLKAMGLPLEQIMEATGLSDEQINLL